MFTILRATSPLPPPRLSPTEPLPSLAPPPDNTYQSREALLEDAKQFAGCHGYALVIERSRDTKLWLKCDRGGVYRNRHHLTEATKKRKRAHSRLLDCPFRLRGAVKEGIWSLTTVNSEHNHEASDDMRVHPSLRRLNDEAKERIRVLTEEGASPAKILQLLQEEQPDIQVLSRDIYNARKKIKEDMAERGIGQPPEPEVQTAIPAEGGQWLWFPDDPLNPTPPPVLQQPRSRHRSAVLGTVPPPPLDPRLHQPAPGRPQTQQGNARPRGRPPTTRSPAATRTTNPSAFNTPANVALANGHNENGGFGRGMENENIIYANDPFANSTSPVQARRPQQLPMAIPASSAPASGPAGVQGINIQQRPAPSTGGPASTMGVSANSAHNAPGSDKIIEVRMARIEKEQKDQNQMLAQILGAVQGLQRR